MKRLVFTIDRFFHIQKGVDTKNSISKKQVIYPFKNNVVSSKYTIDKLGTV